MKSLQYFHFSPLITESNLISLQVIDNAVCDAVVMVLCDGGFFLQHPEHHHTLLQYLTQANPTSANEVRCLLFAAKSLEATSNFLKASNSDLQGFLDLAEKSLPSCSVLQDATILEKLLWGVGRQAKEGSVSEEQLEQSRLILLQCLHSPVLSVRLCGLVFDLVVCVFVCKCACRM